MVFGSSLAAGPFLVSGLGVRLLFFLFFFFVFREDEGPGLVAIADEAA